MPFLTAVRARVFWTCLLAISFGVHATALAADEPTAKSRPKETPGQGPTRANALGPRAVGLHDQGRYLDADRDGRNDRFRDADGDGVDDVSGKKYPHRFRYQDEDGDGLNDLFRDLDGDGVNDLSGALVDADGDGVFDNVIDHDGDGKNDVTGISYTETSLRGFRFGRVDEERSTVHRRFRDQNGDGMNDLLRRRFQFHDALRDRASDSFIDEDGDGIADGRRLQLRERGRRTNEAKSRRQRRRGERSKRPKPKRPEPRKEKR